MRGARSWVWLILPLLSGAACRSDAPSAPIDRAEITAAEAYTPHVGDVWTFVNGYGDTTTITTQAAPEPAACRSGPNVVWSYRKTKARAYWNPGIDSASILFLLHQDPDSSWRSTASVIAFGGGIVYTWDILDNAPPAPNGYRITPPTVRRGDTITIETLADARGGLGLYTLGCASPQGIVAAPGHGEQWRTTFYLERVETPIYSGTAAVSEQLENCNPAHTNPGCGHEKWWFAPGIGLVEVWQINSGSGIEGDEDPKITMVRIR